VPYYLNNVTGEVQWNCPDELKGSEEIKEEGGEWYFVMDDEDAFIPAKFVNSMGGGQVKVETQSGIIHTSAHIRCE